jgi:Tol biopolymer transport system component
LTNRWLTVEIEAMPGTPTPEAIRSQVEKILSNQSFTGLGRLAGFLRFVVDQALEGRGDHIKEYLIGVQVYRKGEAFDPRMDSIVRVEASKLRSILRKYYETDGRRDPVHISIPKGSYVPVFRRQSYSMPVGRPAAAALAAGLLLVVSAGVGIAWRRSSAKSTGGPSLIRLTSDAGLTAYPALSPEGTLVAYASDREGDGNLDLWIQPVSGREPSRLTRHPADDYEPSFSPDGSRIAFRSDRDGGGIYLLPALGGEPTRIAREGRRPRFSPDGAWIAYSVGGKRFFPVAPGSGKLYIVPAGGGAPVELQPGFASAHYPVWSPDGKHVLFLGRSKADGPVEETFDWWVTPVGGGPAVKTGALAVLRRRRLQVPNFPYPSAMQADAWVGNEVLFAAQSQSQESSNLWRIPISPETWQVSEEPERLTFGTGLEMQASAASHTGDLVFASGATIADIWSLSADGTGALRRLTENTAYDFWPSVSADGRKIMFISSRSGNSDVWVKDLETGKETALTRTPEHENWPEISRDASWFTYQLSDGAKMVAYRRTVGEGSAPEKLCEWCECLEPTVDGSALVYARLHPAPEHIVVRNMASGEEQVFLRHGQYHLYQPMLSADNRWLVFYASLALDRSRVYVAPFRPGSSPLESEWIAVTDGSAHDTTPRWSPDSNRLLFASNRDGFLCLWGQRLHPQTKRPAGEAFAVAHFHQASKRLGNVGVTKRGFSVARDKLVFPLEDTKTNVWLLRDGR